MAGQDGDGRGHAADELTIEHDPNAEAEVGETELDKAPERIRKFERSKRFERSKKLIRRDGLFHTYVSNVDQKITPEPRDYPQGEYRRHLEQYTGYKHTYMVDFHLDGVEVRWWEWRNHSDIAANVIERKFPIDRRIRDIITAFKVMLRWNQRRHVFGKRLAQIGASVALLAASVYLLAPEDHPALAELEAAAPRSLDLALLAGSMLLAAAVVVGAHWMFLRAFTGQYRDKMTSAAAGLKSAMNRKTAGIQNQFTTVLRRATNAANAYLPNEREWIDEAIWHIEVAMWLPKRVDYVERFFQLEMQNIRAVRNKWGIAGDLMSLGVFAAGLAGLGVAVMQADSADWMRSAAVAAPAALALWLLFRHSTSRRNSIQNTEIRDWIGEKSWVTVSEFDMFKNVAEVMRHYMHRVFTEDNKGATLPPTTRRPEE